MTKPLSVTRRKVLQYLSFMSAAMPFQGWAKSTTGLPTAPFSFMFLGDLHFDKLMHHDMDYLKQQYPHDIGQIENYSRITRENLSSLMRAAKECAHETDAMFYLQIGDFVEGLCGSKELAAIQTSELISYIEQQQLLKPFIAIKCNHDITGTGAKEVYEEIVLPWQSKQLQQAVTSANNVYVRSNARFVLFDCFNEKESLVWLRKVIKDHKSDEVLLFCTHIPVVPYDARSNWHIYVHPHQQQERDELLNLLAAHKAIVLSGHLHKTSILTRSTPSGNFVQVGVGSVIPSLNSPVKNHLKGLEAYGKDLINLEPDFSPPSVQVRMDILEREKPYIRYYEYADFCGYASVDIDKRGEVNLSVFANADKQPWTKTNLTKLFNT